MGAYGHRIQKIDPDCFRVWWTVDRKVSGSRLRFPRSTSRVTDYRGAVRFAKRHNLETP